MGCYHLLRKSIPVQNREPQRGLSGLSTGTILQDEIDVALSIAIGSATQIALFVPGPGIGSADGHLP